jgi:hypothetical protein
MTSKYMILMALKQHQPLQKSNNLNNNNKEYKSGKNYYQKE